MLEVKVKEFDRMVIALAKNGQAIINDLDPAKANLLHMAVGVSGEAGELLDAIKKHAIYGKQLDRENIKEEAGDILFYLNNILLNVGFTLEEIIEHNISKLSKRYAKGQYSNEQAQERADKEDALDNIEADKRMATQKRISVNIEDL